MVVYCLGFQKVVNCSRFLSGDSSLFEVPELSGLPNRPPVKDKGTVSTFIEDYPTGFLEVAK